MKTSHSSTKEIECNTLNSFSTEYLFESDWLWKKVDPPITSVKRPMHVHLVSQLLF